MPKSTITRSKSANSKAASKEKKTKSIDKPKKAAKQAPRSKSTAKTKKKEIDSFEKEALVYSAGSYIAFLDPEAEDPSKFKIGLITSDVKQHDDEILCDAFELKPKSDLLYALVAGKHALAEHVIVSEVKVEVTKTSGKGKNKKVQQVEITKQQSNKVKKLVPNILRSLQALNSEQDQEEEEPEELDEEDDQILEVVSSPKRVLRIKGVKKQEAKRQSSKKDIEIDDQEDILQIDTSTKKSVKTQNPKKSSKIPEIGKKRPRNKVDQEDEDVKSSNDGEALVATVQTQKRRKIGSSHSQKVVQKSTAVIVPKAAKEKPKPKEYKRGVWNPDIELITEELHKTSTDSNIDTSCCMACSSKNIVRAVLTKNKALFKKCIHDKHNVSQVFVSLSSDTEENILNILLERGDNDFLQMLYCPDLNTKTGKFKNDEDAAKKDLFQNRSTLPNYLLKIVEQGRVSNMAYGGHIRQVGMTRGNRQGNQAFLEQKSDGFFDKQVPDAAFQRVQGQHFMKRRKISVETFKVMERLIRQYDVKQNFLYQIATLVRVGDHKLAEYLIKNVWEQTNYGFNELHYLALQDVKKVAEKIKSFKSVSVQKKCQTACNITPLHIACINPNAEILRMFLEVNSDFQMTDINMKRPIHYAAANENMEALKLLIQKGANLSDVCSQKVTPLHAAAIAMRPKNVELILNECPSLIKLRDRAGKTAMAYACENQDLETIKILVQKGIKLGPGLGPNRMNPLAWAAALGNYEICEWLLDNKARVISGDKYKRTPLILAVKNGHTKIASLLLQRGADWNQADSSGNTPLHFAAAYGQRECIDLLLKAGADINAENSWRITPINASMLLNHEGCVKKFLSYPEVDVNCVDEKGRTLLTTALLDLNDRTLEFVKYLIDKGADPNKADVDGQASLHYLAQLDPKQHGLTQWSFNHDLNPQKRFEEESKRLIEKRSKIQMQLAQLLLSKGASLKLADKEKRTPFALCLQRDNIELLNYLVDDISVDEDPQVLHTLKSFILNTKYQALLQRILNNKSPQQKNMNELNEIGLTPFLSYVEHFCTSYETLRSKLMELVNAQSLKYGNKFDKYEINIDSLFVQENPNNNHNRFGNRRFGGGFGGGFGSSNINEPASNVIQPTHQEKSVYVDDMIDKNITQPFVEMLRILVWFGADPHQKVGKLLSARQLEEKLRLKNEESGLQKMDNTGKEGNAQQIKEAEAKLKKREEVLLERQKNEKMKMKKAPKKKNTQTSLKEIKKLKKQMKKEPEYHATMGLQTALHLAVSCPIPDLCKALFGMKINPDETDLNNRTPLNLCSQKFTNGLMQNNLNSFIDMLLNAKVRPDFPDKNGRTPFLNFFENSAYAMANKFLDNYGVNVNQMDKTGFYALKYAMIRRDGDKIEELVKKYKANINQVDQKGRNLLHHAVNLSSATADASFETEQLLLDLGVDINCRDHHQRTPLHYAFVKIGNWGSKESVDPIETVSSLCGFKKLEINVPDKWMKTPLHYASQRGASICAVYLEKRGAQLEAVDIYGNTPLGVALISGHHSYGILLIQKHADVKRLVYNEDPLKIEKMWKEQAQKDRPKDEQMESEDSDSDNDEKHRQLFDKKDLKNQFYDDEDDDYYDEEESDDSDVNFEQNQINANNPFQGTVQYAKKAAPIKASAFGAFGGFGQAPQGIFAGQVQPQPVQEQVDSNPQVPKSMFRRAINAGQLGLAYLMMDEGYGLMLAVQDAMDEKKFQLVLTLLAKTADDTIVQQMNSKGQTLLHVLAQNTSGCKTNILVRIYNQLKQRKVNFQAKDHLQRTALHYAVDSRSPTLVNLLINDQLSAKDVDSNGFCPLVIYLKGDAPLKTNLYVPSAGGLVSGYDTIFEALVKAGADVNRIYPEKDFKSIYEKDQPYKTTIAINYVRRLAQTKQINNLCSSLQGLKQFKAKYTLTDSDGRDLMSYAILNNNFKLVEYLIGTDARDLNLQNQDKAGKSAVHLVVNPCEFGSYENIKILQVLADVGYPLDLKDSARRTPSSYAKEQKSGVLIKRLALLIGDSELAKQPKRQLSGLSIAQWPKSQVNPDEDAAIALKKAEEAERAELALTVHQKELVPVDKVGQFSKSHKVFCEGLKPWDVYLTKVDLKNGIYGDFVFYKMQLLHDSVRDLYIVFTRYGRIGEDGMHQRSPFNNIDEAKKDFCTIFKSKTGNDFTDLENFTRVKKKYALSKVAYVTVAHKDYLAPFDFDNCPKSKLEKNTRKLLEEVANVTMYQRAMSSLGIDTDSLPVSSLTKDTIKKAMEILSDIKKRIDEDTELSKAGWKADIEKLTVVRESIADLSSRFYELIPQSKYANQIAPPLNNERILKESVQSLTHLTNIEQANKILLGALFNQSKMHPVDYVYEALNLQINYLEPQDPETQLIEKYVKNTHQGSIDLDRKKIVIFKVQRKGEAEKIEPFLEHGNSRLLYHGSSLVNYLGILSQGLRIAPPEAPTTGYMLGKGVYFADMFSKSHGYASQTFGSGKDSSLLILCETALGNIKRMRVPEFVEDLPEPHHSVQGLGREGPDYDFSIKLPNGIEVPCGPVTQYDHPEFKANAIQTTAQTAGLTAPQLGANEFVVYNTDQIRMRYLIQIVEKSKEELSK